MKEALRILFVALVLFMLVFPMAGLLQPKTAPTPERPDAFVEENLLYRDYAISLHSLLSEELFGETGNTQVVQGKNDFLYFAETLSDFFTRSPSLAQDAEWLAHTLWVTNEALAQQNIRFVFMAAPNKNTLYPENMPYYTVSTGEESLLSRLENRLGELGVPSANALAALEAAKGPQLLYYTNDTHWNSLGAHAAYLALMGKLAGGETLSYTPYDTNSLFDVPILGDLVPLYMPLQQVPAVDTPQMIPQEFRWEGPMRSLSQGLLHTRSDKNSLKLLMFRDSFGDGLFEYIANNVGQLAYARAFPSKQALVDSEAPGALVLEIAQRNLWQLVESPPQLAAPAVDLPGPFSELPADYTWQLEGGYVHITGRAELGEGRQPLLSSPDQEALSRLIVRISRPGGEQAAYRPYLQPMDDGEGAAIGFSLVLPEVQVSPGEDAVTLLYCVP